MSLLRERQPQNLNELQTNNFRFSIRKCPVFSYFTQRVNIPGMVLGRSPVGTPFATMAIPGDHMKFGDLQVTFKVDELLAGWMEIYDWMTAIGRPYDGEDLAAIVAQPQTSGNNETVDATLTILNARQKPIMRFEFQEVSPTSLGGWDEDSTPVDVVFAQALATFSYTRYRAYRVDE